MDTVAPFINTSIQYIKGFNPLETTLFKTVSGFSIFSSKPKDISGATDGSGIDGSGGEAFNDSPTPSPGIMGAITAVAENPSGTTVLNLIMELLYVILVIMLASFVANSLIFAHWGLRLFAFIFILYLTSGSSMAVTVISAYFIIRALRNGYLNFRDKPTNKLSLFPPHYAMLPIMTCRGTKTDFLNPFCYFKKGHDPKDAKFHYFKLDESKRKAELDSVVPGIKQIKSQYSSIAKKFIEFLKEINKSYIIVNGAPKESLEQEDADAKAERDAIEQHITGVIAKTTGVKSVDYIKSLGKVAPAAATPVAATPTKATAAATPVAATPTKATAATAAATAATAATAAPTPAATTLPK